jgi:hypothetical protein
LLLQMHLYAIVGRHVPTARDPKPKIFRMKVFAEDEVRLAASRSLRGSRCRLSVWSRQLGLLLLLLLPVWRGGAEYAEIPWADPQVKGKSKFWYFIRQFKRIKRANGEILSVNEVRVPLQVPDGAPLVLVVVVVAGGASVASVVEGTLTALVRLQIFEKKPLKVKNFGVSMRYNSRTDPINMYKEYRDVTLTGAISQMCKWPACRASRARRS